MPTPEQHDGTEGSAVDLSPEFLEAVRRWENAPHNRPGTDKTKGYRGHFARMGFDGTLTELESRRDNGATEDELARNFPDELLRRVGYWGKPEGARDAFLRLAQGLDIGVVRLVPARRNDLTAARLGLSANTPCPAP